MSSRPVSYLIPRSLTPEDIYRSLGKRLDLRKSEKRALERAYLDTFDWALHGASAILEAERGEQALVLRLDSGGERLDCSIQSSSVPAFLDEIPPGPLRDALSPLLKIRRLLVHVAVEVLETQWVILDRRRKTVARVLIEARTLIGEGAEHQPTELPARCLAVPVKGYKGWMKKLVASLESMGLSGGEYESELDELLAAIGRRAGDYSSKLRVKLEPAASAGSALRLVLLSLLDAMVANEDGVRRNLDTEFLHDFRVAVRRTRTALGQVRDVLAPAEVAAFRASFSWLGKVTGPTRDLDVYLLKMGDYRALLPAGTRRHLEPLEEHLVERQQQEHRALVAALDSPRYRSLIEEWRAYLEHESGGGRGEPTSAALPLGQIAAREIRRVWSRVLKRGSRIDDSSPDAELHRVRIDCKKLRYLLEFFRSLAPVGEVKQAIATLKKLQDNLGDFNDYVVQQEMLSRFAEDLVATGRAPSPTLLAMGRLVGNLEQGERRERAAFSDQFRRFAGAKSRRIFERLVVDLEGSARA